MKRWPIIMYILRLQATNVPFTDKLVDKFILELMKNGIRELPGYLQMSKTSSYTSKSTGQIH